MCNFGPRPVDLRPPHQKLAELMSKELDVSINPAALRLFLQSKWGDVAPLAHAIHDEGKAP